MFDLTIILRAPFEYDSMCRIPVAMCPSLEGQVLALITHNLRPDMVVRWSDMHMSAIVWDDARGKIQCIEADKLATVLKEDTSVWNNNVGSFLGGLGTMIVVLYWH